MALVWVPWVSDLLCGQKLEPQCCTHDRPPSVTPALCAHGRGNENTRTFLSTVLEFRKERWGSLHGHEMLITEILKHLSLYCLSGSPCT